MGERLRSDAGLWIAMAVVLLLEALASVAFAVGLVWLTFSVAKGWALTVFVVMIVAVGAKTSAAGVRRASHRGRDVTAGDRARVRTALERLCVVGDIAEPAVEVRESPLPQSWTMAVPWTRPRVFVTTGLLDLLDDGQLEAVVAHELSHIAHRDALVMTIAAAPGVWMLRGLRHTFREERRDDAFNAYLSVPAGILLALPALPFALLARVLSRLRERAADAGAALLTGSPAAVSAALVAVSDELAARRRTDLRDAVPAELNIVPLRPAHGVARLWATHPPLDARLAALARMEARLQSPTGRTSGR